MNYLEHLKLIRDNPGVYKSLPDAQLADLLLQLLETKSLFKKAKVEMKNGKDGLDGVSPASGVDFMSPEQQREEIARLVNLIEVSRGTDGSDGIDGADADITEEDIQQIVDIVYSAIDIPAQLSHEEVRDRLELLTGDDRLDKKAIRGIEGIEKDIEDLKNKPEGKGGGGLGKHQVQKLINTSIGSIDNDSTPEFEKTNKNLSSYPNTLTYTSGVLTSIAYSTGTGTITKTFAYTGDNLTSVTLSGDLPVGLTETVKTLSYTGSDLTGIAYA